MENWEKIESHLHYFVYRNDDAGEVIQSRRLERFIRKDTLVDLMHRIEAYDGKLTKKEVYQIIENLVKEYEKPTT